MECQIDKSEHFAICFFSPFIKDPKLPKLLETFVQYTVKTPSVRERHRNGFRVPLRGTSNSATTHVPVDPCSWKKNNWMISFTKIRVRPRENRLRKWDALMTPSLIIFTLWERCKSSVLGYHMFSTKITNSSELPSPPACSLGIKPLLATKRDFCIE